MPTLTVWKPVQPEQRRPVRLLVTMADGRLFCVACQKALVGATCPEGHR